MDVESLKSYIQNVFSSTSTVQVYMLLKQDGIFSLKLANLEDEKTEPEVKNLFENFIKEHIITNNNLEIRELSTDDEKEDSIYHYDYDDYDEYPEELSLFKSFNIEDSANNYDKFNFKDDDLKYLYGYIIYIGTMDKGILLF
ncbi:MAG: hypothetical protein MJ147_00070 [Clostridia bacterium]|nr:hypothetical protein [Clostridia bacterium]